MNIQEAIFSAYPLAKDCIEGHVGTIVETTEEEMADDRYYRIKVQRCSHCNMPCGGADYV